MRWLSGDGAYLVHVPISLPRRLEQFALADAHVAHTGRHWM